MDADIFEKELKRIISEPNFMKSKCGVEERCTTIMEAINESIDKCRSQNKWKTKTPTNKFPVNPWYNVKCKKARKNYRKNRNNANLKI
jgi:hypothetical protein